MNYATLFAGNDDPDYYPEQICAPCGHKYGHRVVSRLVTWHKGTCGICGVSAPVCEPRDFCHLRDGWREMAVKDAGTK